MTKISHKCWVLLALALAACDADPGSIRPPVVLRVTGVVSDAASQPLAGVAVSVRALDETCAAPLSPDSVVTTTDSTGRYSTGLRVTQRWPSGCVGVTAWPPAGALWEQASGVSEPAAVASGDSIRLDVQAPQARVLFEWIVPPSVSLTPEALSIRFDDGTGARSLGGRDFTTEGYALPHTETLATRTWGSLVVDVAVVSGDTIAAGSIALPLRPDWIWGVDLRITDGDPLAGCFGCSGAKTLPLRRPVPGAPGDSVYLVWAGSEYPAVGIR